MTYPKKSPHDDLRQGVVLAELGGHGDGPYCATHGAGGALVIMGTYIVDPGNNVPYPKHFVFKPGRKNYEGYLKEHVAAARASGAKVGVSAVSVELKETLEFLQAAEAAGADYAAYCAHSEMKMFVSKGLSSMLCQRDKWGDLEKWAGAIVRAVRIPVIFKTGAEKTIEETVGAVEVLAESGVPVVSINVYETSAESKGLKILAALKGKCPCLVGGGGVSDLEGARRVLKTGADAVAIGTAAMKNPLLIGQIQKALRA